MTDVLIGAAAADVLSLVVTWVSKRRDEARLGGAAERRLRADLQSSLGVLDGGRPSAAWLKPGIRVTVWRDQFEHLVPRFRPAFWNRINDAVDTLDRLQGWAETNASDGKLPAEPPLTRRRQVSLSAKSRRSSRSSTVGTTDGCVYGRLSSRGRKAILPLRRASRGALLQLCSLSGCSEVSPHWR